MTRPSNKQLYDELAEANQALDDAQHNFTANRLTTAVSRSYYAVFHAARTLLWSKGLGPKTHKGLISLFGENIVKPGIVSKDLGRILTKIHDERELADYHAMTGNFDPAEVEQLVNDAQIFVNTIEELLNTE